MMALGTGPFAGAPTGSVANDPERKSGPVKVALGLSSMLIASRPPGSLGPWTKLRLPT